MRKIKCLVVGLSVVMCVGRSIVKADANETISVGVSADFYEKYVWRGQYLVDD